MRIEASVHSGASFKRKSLQAYDPSMGDTDSDDLPDIPTLRARSRDLYRNNNHGRGAINNTVLNVVGGGLKMNSKVDAKALNLTDDQANDLEEIIEREWRYFSESKDVDRRRQMDFNGIQNLALLSALQSGDCFLLFPTKERNKRIYETTLHLIEADQCSNPNFAPDQKNMAGGVETDDAGEPIKYHFLKRHPGNTNTFGLEWVPIEPYSESGRTNLLHLTTYDRPGQRRGIPFLAPVIESLKQLGRYSEAELMAAVISGMFTVYITNPTGERLGLDSNTAPSPADSADIALGNGAAVELSEGQDVKTANPGRPNANFDPFFTSIVRQIGSSLGIPFETLVLHFTSSYSASRAALLEAWKFYRTKREWLVKGLCQPVFEMFFREAVLKGRISAPGFFDDQSIQMAYTQATWSGAGMGQIDPVKETKAAQMRVQSGFSTRTAEAQGMNGSSFERNAEQLARENTLLKEKGLITDENDNLNDVDLFTDEGN